MSAAYLARIQLNSAPIKSHQGHSLLSWLSACAGIFYLQNGHYESADYYDLDACRLVAFEPRLCQYTCPHAIVECVAELSQERLKKAKGSYEVKKKRQLSRVLKEAVKLQHNTLRNVITRVIEGSTDDSSDEDRPLACLYRSLLHWSNCQHLWRKGSGQISNQCNSVILMPWFLKPIKEFQVAEAVKERLQQLLQKIDSEQQAILTLVGRDDCGQKTDGVIRHYNFVYKALRVLAEASGNKLTDEPATSLRAANCDLCTLSDASSPTESMSESLQLPEARQSPISAVEASTPQSNQALETNISTSLVTAAPARSAPDFECDKRMPTSSANRHPSVIVESNPNSTSESIQLSETVNSSTTESELTCPESGNPSIRMSLSEAKSGRAKGVSDAAKGELAGARGIASDEQKDRKSEVSQDGIASMPLQVAGCNIEVQSDVGPTDGLVGNVKAYPATSVSKRDASSAACDLTYEPKQTDSELRIVHLNKLLPGAHILKSGASEGPLLTATVAPRRLRGRMSSKLRHLQKATSEIDTQTSSTQSQKPSVLGKLLASARQIFKFINSNAHICQEPVLFLPA